jgi:hypothetical protein
VGPRHSGRSDSTTFLFVAFAVITLVPVLLLGAILSASYRIMPRPCTAFVVGDSSARQSRLGNDGAFQCHGSRGISTALIRALELEPSLRYLTPKNRRKCLPDHLYLWSSSC